MCLNILIYVETDDGGISESTVLNKYHNKVRTYSLYNTAKVESLIILYLNIKAVVTVMFMKFMYNIYGTCQL